MRLGVIVLLMFLSGCTLGAKARLPPPPTLPEVTYVPPCDPKAVAGLTHEAIDALRNRDMLLRQHIETLEQQLHGSR
jgi:hypothetical protein